MSDNGPQYPTNYQLEGNANRFAPLPPVPTTPAPTTMELAIPLPISSPTELPPRTALTMPFLAALAGAIRFAGPAISVLISVWRSAGKCLGAMARVCNSVGKFLTSRTLCASTYSRPQLPLAAAWPTAIRPILGTSVEHSPRRASCSSRCVTNFRIIHAVHYMAMPTLACLLG